MSRKLTDKQKKFADLKLETGNATQSALKTYDTEDYDTAKSIGHENLTKPHIIAYLESKQPEYINRMDKLSLTAKSDMVKFVSTKDLLDRSGLKPIEKTQSVNFNVDIKLDETERRLKDKYEQELKASFIG